MSRVLGIDPNTGLLAGSITLSGGHATGAVYSKLPFFSGVPNAAAVAIAFATFGLVLGGIIGGPISQLLIARHKLAPEDKVMHPDDALKDHGYNEPETVTARSVIQVLYVLFLLFILVNYFTLGLIHSLLLFLGQMQVLQTLFLFYLWGWLSQTYVT